MTDLNEENDFTTFRKNNNPTYQDAFAAFKQRFLIDKKSIFNLGDDSDILTKKSLDYLIENFVKNGYSGNATFSEKIKYQLVKKPESEDTSDKKLLMKGAIEILATAVWLWRLAPYNSTQAGKIKAVKEILFISTCEILAEKKGDDDKPLSIEDKLKTNNFFHCDIKGFASSGMRYNMNKPNELAYIIRFFEACINKNSSEIDSLIGNGVLQKNEVDVQVKHDYSRKEKGNNNPELDKLNKGDLEKWKAKYIDGKKPKNKDDEEPKSSASVHNAILHWLKPDDYEPILSNDYKKKIKKTFEHLLDDKSEAKDSPAIDEILTNIKEKLTKEPYCIDATKAFYSDNIRSLWMSDIDFEAKNIILHGAPGTGKTYLTEKTIKSRIAFDNPTSPIDDYFKLVQFHPSYGYEDFIDGIKPAGMDSNGNLKFELVNGEFKEMCIKAFKELVRFNALDSEGKKGKEPKKFYFIADEINRAELSRVFGELLLCLEEDKRLRFEDGELKGTKIKTQNSKLWEKKHAVVVMNGTTVVPVCETKEGILEWHEEGKEFFFGVPENLYFIGTMNDIDRSVDSFDMALRRRFLWKHYQCDYDVLVEHYKIEEDHPYIEACRNLNKHITGSGTEKNKGFDLGESYELGHSYFMKPKKLKNEQMGKVWEDHIAPLLKEYLRTTYAENEIVKKLKEAKKIFTLPKEKNVNSNR